MRHLEEELAECHKAVWLTEDTQTQPVRPC